MSCAYLYWRPISWKKAFWIVVAIHGLYNGTLYVRLLTSQVQRDIVSAQRTGDAFAWDTAESLFKKAQSAANSGDNTREIDILHKAINVYPYDANYYVAMGEVLRDRHELADAETAERKAITLDASSVPGWLALSGILFKEQRYPESMNAAQTAMGVATPDERPYVQQGIDSIQVKLTGTGKSH